MNDNEDKGTASDPGEGTSQAPELTPLSKKAKIHYGRLYQIHAWMSPEEKTRVQAPRALFDNVNALKPGYFNQQVDLMDDTTVKYLPCRDFQLNKCSQQRPIHHVSKMKSNGKRSSVLVIHGCDLCFYGRWDLGFHTLNNCHLKHLTPNGTGEKPWDRRERKSREEKEKAKQPNIPAKKTNQKKKLTKTKTVQISSSSSSSSSSEGESKKRKPDNQNNPAKTKRKKVTDNLRKVTGTLASLTEAVDKQNKIFLQHVLRASFVPPTQATNPVDTSQAPSGEASLSMEADPGMDSAGNTKSTTLNELETHDELFKDTTPIGGGVNEEERDMQELNMDYNHYADLINSQEEATDNLDEYVPQ